MANDRVICSQCGLCYFVSAGAHRAGSNMAIIFQKISIRPPCLNFAVYSSHMLPRWLRRLDELLFSGIRYFVSGISRSLLVQTPRAEHCGWATLTLRPSLMKCSTISSNSKSWVSVTGRYDIHVSYMYCECNMILEKCHLCYICIVGLYTV